jgi:asparagine synthase (glutamine-hydrolysing)
VHLPLYDSPWGDLKEMPGIFGCVARKDALVPAPLAKQMADSLKHEEWYEAEWLSEPCLLGVVELRFLYEQGKRIQFDEKRQLIGAFRGNIYNKEDLAKRLCIPTDLDDVQFIVRLYRAKDFHFPKYLNGLFSLAIYDVRENRLLIANDRYGAIPLFYTLNPKRFLFAPEIKAILKDIETPAKLNSDAVPEFFTLHCNFGDKTLFQDVNKLQPANVLVYDQNQDRIFLKTYWDFPTTRKKFDSNMPLEDCLREFGRLMEKAIWRAVKDRDELGIFLSGGLDSRIITAFATRTNKEITTFTFGTKNCPQQKIAKRLAQRLGVENVFYEIPSDSIAKNAEKIVYNGDGSIRIRESHFLSLLAEVQKQVNTVLLGTFGDIFGLYNAKKYSKTFRKEETLSLLVKIWATALRIEEQQQAFSPDFYEKTKGKLLKNFLRIVNSIPFESGLDFASYVIYRVQEPCSTLYNVITPVNWYLETRHPFLDNDLVDFFALRLPLHLNSHKRFLQKAMNYFFPSLSHIPLEQGYFPDSPYIIELLGEANLFIGDMAKSYLQKLSRGRVTLPLDYRGYDQWLRTGSKTFVLDLLLDPRTLKRNFFKEDYIKGKLEEHMSGKKNHDELICDLVNFELLNRIFIPERTILEKKTPADDFQ